MDDSILEENETFVIVLETGDLGVDIPLQPGLNNATVTITDNDGMYYK